MSKRFVPAVLAALLLGGCASVPRGSIPVVDAGSSIGQPAPAQGGYGASVQAQSTPEDAGVVVMVPGGSAAPIQSFPAPGAASEPWSPTVGASDGYGSVPAPVAPSGIPGNLAQDEQLDGPVLALLTTAQQQQGGGDLNGAAASLERAQRIAPREPQVLYRLAEVRLAQGDAAQAEQFARRGLSYAAGRPALQASLWNLIAQARERQGDAAGAAQAREQARVSL
ncbi:tetratricopeptide repeat protein [Pseudomonas xionganensis]|uniref:Uncharacterized protein n=1 Tax=Pseudomonas xionganensis TaxID=2654845 RepID=A0A6I4KW26_9PSED|nr:tetratricopeptide repeat protein [Pseudomonas xionganensis]MVW76615.1 hypothetical protein [Pseudomonas xionganensis]